VGPFSDLSDWVVVTIDGFELVSFSDNEASDDDVDEFESSSPRKNLGFEVVDPGVGAVAAAVEDGKSADVIVVVVTSGFT